MNQSLAAQLISPVQTLPNSNGSLGPNLKIGNKTSSQRRQKPSHHWSFAELGTSRRFSAPLTLPAENRQGLAFAPVWARLLTTSSSPSTLGLGVLSLWVVPCAKHELAGHQGVGESPPCVAVRRSKLNSFLSLPPCVARIPPTNPLPGTVLAGPLVGGP